VTGFQTITVFFATNNGLNFVLGTAQPWQAPRDTVVSGDGIPIMWQSKDADVLSRAAAMTPSARLSPPAITAPSSSSTTTTPTNLSTPSSGLSTGAKIGLGVGLPVAVILAVVLGLLLWRRCSKQHRTVDASASAYESYQGAMEYKDGRVAPAYSGSQPVHEMQDPNQTHGTTHEMPAGGQR
jgi:hypothetical protein